MSKQIDMSRHMTPLQVFGYTAPTIVMMLFCSVYDIVDGFFVSVYAGVTAFAALDLIMPYLLILGSLGFMVGAGANAVIANALSKDDTDKANGLFSFFIYALFIFGLVVFVMAQIFLEPVAIMFGAEPGSELLEQCILFGRLSLISTPAFMLQYAFQSLFSTAGKPLVGMAIIVTSGLINVACDCFFVAQLGMGVAGAGISTTIAEIFGGIVPVIYFFCPNSSSLRLGRPRVDFKTLAGVCANGSSELVTNVATSVVAIFFNLQLMRYIGENGVAAYGVIMYAGMIVAAVIMGYSVGCAPLVSYQHGKGNRKEKLHLIEISATFVAFMNVIMFFIVQMSAIPLADIFAGYDRELRDLTIHAFRVYSFAFLFMGFSMYASSLFTSLGSSVISGTISFGRTIILEVGCVMLFPLIMGAEGIWFSIIAAEFIAMCISTFFVLGYAKKYDYSPTFIIPIPLPGALDDVVDDAVEALSDRVVDGFGSLEDAVDDMGDSLGDSIDAMGEAIDDMRGSIGDSIEGLADAIRGDEDTFDDLADFIRGDIDDEEKDVLAASAVAVQDDKDDKESKKSKKGKKSGKGKKGKKGKKKDAKKGKKDKKKSDNSKKSDANPKKVKKEKKVEEHAVKLKIGKAFKLEPQPEEEIKKTKGSKAEGDAATNKKNQSSKKAVASEPKSKKDATEAKDSKKTKAVESGKKSKGKSKVEEPTKKGKKKAKAEEPAKKGKAVESDKKSKGKAVQDEKGATSTKKSHDANTASSVKEPRKKKGFFVRWADSRKEAAEARKKMKEKKNLNIRYESTDERIATVSKDGVVRSNKKGTCYINAYLGDEMFAKVKVEVKK